MPIRTLIAYFCSGFIAALLYYQVPPQWIIAAWVALGFTLISTALLLDEEVLL